jgi:hypothetical protein
MKIKRLIYAFIIAIVSGESSEASLLDMSDGDEICHLLDQSLEPNLKRSRSSEEVTVGSDGGLADKFIQLNCSSGVDTFPVVEPAQQSLPESVVKKSMPEFIPLSSDELTHLIQSTKAGNVQDQDSFVQAFYDRRVTVPIEDLKKQGLDYGNWNFFEKAAKDDVWTYFVFELGRVKLLDEVQMLVLEKYRPELIKMNARANKGDLAASYNLSFMYRHGIFFPKDLAAAHTFIEKAANGNHMLALCDLADMYETGEGVQPNTLKAMVVLKKAMDLGSAYARKKFNDLLDGEQLF